jgi:hypothetical protein
MPCYSWRETPLTWASPTAWRKILKDLITYFREVQTHYEHRAKSLLKLSNVLNNTATPPGFLASDGLDDALQILRGHNKQAIAEANKAREIEEDVILALTGLRSDLHQKIKEIKNLSGDFKNSVEKEMDNTRRAVNQLQEALGQTELDPSLTIGKQDPYLLRLAVDRQLERQIDEENYLHQVRTSQPKVTVLVEHRGHLTMSRRTLIWRTLGRNSSPLSSARFRRPTTHTLASSSGNLMPPTMPSRSFGPAPSPCLRTRNGRLSSRETIAL